MRVVIQRVLHASVTVDGSVVGKIGAGMLVLLGITHGDSAQECDFIIKKLLNLRMFAEGEHSFEKNVVDVQGEILIVSQFTLYGDCTNGNRPSFSRAMAFADAEKLYQQFLKKIFLVYPHVQTGVFGADMSVELVNDGPVTLELES